MTSTVQDRIKGLENFRALQIKKEQQEETNKLNEKAMLIEEIRARKQRITDLITLANACLSNGIKLNISEYGGSSSSKTFIAESIHHSLGFCNEAEYSASAKTQVKFIGFNGGGWCGEWHFRTDGDTIVEYGHVWDTDEVKKRNLCDIPNSQLKNFIDKFDKFETRFLEYVDSHQG